jgi:hypothetical protein
MQSDADPSPEGRELTSADPFQKPRLTAAEVSAFEHDGYLIYKNSVLPAERFQALQRHFEDFLAGLADQVRPEDLDVPHLTDTKLFDWLLDDAVLDLVEPIIGPDIALFSSHLICKPPERGRRVPWHEDRYYWKGALDPIEVVTVWLAIDRSTRENGAMKVVARSHRRSMESEYMQVDTETNVFGAEIKPHQIDAANVVVFELEPNQASLHHSGTMHASDANTSNLRRCGYTMRYMSTRVRFNHEARGDWHQVYLARGKDHAGNRYGDPGRAYHDIMARRHGTASKGH